jgi:hypothetical protein
MAKDVDQTAGALLEAHVAFLVQELTDERFADLLEEEIGQVLRDASRLTVNEVVSPEQIRATALKYAVEFEPSGAIPELVGDIARQIYDHPGHDQATLQDLLSDAQFSEFLDKALEMKDLRDRVIHEAVTNPVYEALVSDITYQSILGYMTENPVTRNVPGAQSMMKLGKNVVGKAGGEALEKNLKAYISKNLKPLLRESEHFLQDQMDEQRLRETAHEIWDGIKNYKIATFRDYVSQRDVEEFFVIGYEYWKSLRQTEYYASWIDTGVNFFFEKYGESTLSELLDEVGVTRELIVDDAQRFAPAILRVLREKGLLEETLRRHLARFYHSEQVRSILAGD